MTAIPLMKLIDVTKQYPAKLALSSVSLSIYRGTALVLRGTNGSGKSTLIKIIGGFVPPTSGKRVVETSAEPVISYAPDRFPKLKFTSVEYLMHMGAIRGLDKSALQRRIGELHARFRLPSDNRQYMRHYSKGMLQKVNMMQAMLLKPDLLLLDEPLSGLDSDTCRELVSVLTDLKADGVTLVIAAHETSFIEQIADRIVTVSNGAIHEDDLPTVNRDGGSVEVWFRYSGNPERIGIEAGLEGILSFDGENGLNRCRVRSSDCDALLLAILTAGGSVLTVSRGEDGEE